MYNYLGTELEAYGRGIEAGHRIGEYEGNDDPQCPYPNGSKEDEAWRNGFGDATEDLIAYQSM